MSRLRDFFVEEAEECLRAARTELAREAPDRGVVYRAVRRLRGSAQLAGYGPIARDAAALESRLRPGTGKADRESGAGTAAAAALESLAAALARVRSGAMNPGEEAENPMEGEARGDGVPGMEELEYRGPAALERALELRAAIEDAVVSQAPVGPLLDELFDLIRLGMR